MGCCSQDLCLHHGQSEALGLIRLETTTYRCGFMGEGRAMSCGREIRKFMTLSEGLMRGRGFVLFCFSERIFYNILDSILRFSIRFFLAVDF